LVQVQPFFAQLTAERPYSLQLAALSPIEIDSSHGDQDPHLIHDSIGPIELTTQMASRLVQQ